MESKFEAELEGKYIFHLDNQDSIPKKRFSPDERYSDFTEEINLNKKLKYSRISAKSLLNFISN